MQKATMVLEGGATRGVFSSGALDYLMEQDFYTSHVVGVSAGSCNGVDYVSKQIGRTRDCMIHKEKEYDYHVGFRKFVKEKSILDMDMVFDKYPKEIFPFDFDTYFASEMECEIVTTNCVTGKAEYMTERSDRDRLMKLCRASSSMPLVSPIVNVDGVPYLDGGLADPIPLLHSVLDGNRKNVVVMTKEAGYRRKPSGQLGLIRLRYARYPKVYELMKNRHIEYNRTLDYLQEQVKNKTAFLIQPAVKSEVGRIEKDEKKLRALYEEGYEEAGQRYDALMEFLES